MARLPTVGGDSGNWGSVLNEYLQTAHNADGTLKLDVKTIADLKSIDVATLTDKQQALVAGYYAPGDGGGGQFYYDAAASDADNGGTIFAPTAGSGRWRRVYSGAVNVRWFGAKGDAVINPTTKQGSGGTNDTPAFEAAFAASSAVYVPAGVYRLTATLWNKGSLIGESTKNTFLFFDAVAGDGIKFSDGVWEVGTTIDYQELRNFRIKGSLTGSYRIAVRVENTRYSVVDNISVSMNNGTGACYAAFGFSDCWGCTFSNLWTYYTALASTGVGFLLGRAYNANTAYNWYTSNLNCLANIMDDAAATAFPSSGGSGNSFNNMCLQGGRYGIRITGQLKACVWTGFYSENVVTPIYLGGSGVVAYSHTFIGGILGGPSVSHPRYSERRACIELYYARHCQFTNINFDGVYGTPPTLYAIWMHTTLDCCVDGGKVMGSITSITPYIVRSVTSGGGNKLIIRGDHSDASGTYNAMSIVMPVDDAWLNHRIMTVGNDGAWKSVQWAPVATDSPPA
jgi:hypothetical protein